MVMKEEIRHQTGQRTSAQGLEIIYRDSTSQQFDMPLAEINNWSVATFGT